MSEGDITITRKMLEDLKNIMKGLNCNQTNEKHSTPWSQAEEEFLILYHGKYLADIGLIRTKHIAMALGRPLGGVQKKIESLRVEGRLK